MIILRRRIQERKYSIASDIYHSGLKRAYKKNVGRARVKIAKKIEDSIYRDYKQKPGIKDIEASGVINPKLRENLLKNEISKRGLVSRKNLEHKDAFGGRKAMTRIALRNLKQARKIEQKGENFRPTLREGKKMARALERGKKGIILYDPRIGVEGIAMN